MAQVDCAMVLAAGLGRRMHPITDTIPKPLVKVAGRTLLDRALDTLVIAGISRAVVNVHHFADQISTHLASRNELDIVISNETEQLLDSAGGIVKALPHLGNAPFMIVNADSFWFEDEAKGLAKLRAGWDADKMDMHLLLARPERASGHGDGRDFLMDEDGRLMRAHGSPDGVIYSGAAIIDPGIFAGARAEPHGLNSYFDRAIEDGRLFGSELDGDWFTVGTPAAVGEAEARLQSRGG